ncbi:hypothetical protein PP740_gp045 [Stenotrophomonas phage Philippe]|uniref:Uncharacterized protein n=1 Tax=Stenotrophomonas phage Philippe TaxID=2859655 RepID=A0AAE8BI38_9CAUD|nr:hypothetical protein PP740_gp045 [Stenotrophomonas phage Philippe]QYW02244.1 hypothetical protein CPT_Philippe_045 [Stenotrophomonas phage Philippe]
MKPVSPKSNRSPMARKVPKNHPWRHTMVVPKDPTKQFLPLPKDGHDFLGGTTKKNRFQ